MKKTTKNLLVSGLVLLLIGGVCVALLAVANKYLQYTPELDAAMAEKLSAVCAAENESDPVASYEPVKWSDENIDLAQFNRTAGVEKTTADAFHRADGNPTTRVMAAYRVIAGDNAGAVIIQAQSKGRDGTVSMLVAFNAELKLIGLTADRQTESYWSRVSDDILARYHDMDAATAVRKDYPGDNDPGGVITGTGATRTMRAVHYTVLISAKMAVKLDAGGAA